MKIMQRKPGVILLPVSVVFIIFVILLILLIGQKQSNNALVLEYKASRIVNLLLDLYVNEQQIDPDEIDENILGYGIYNENNKPVMRYGSAPLGLPSENRYGETVVSDNKKIIIIRHTPDTNALPMGGGAVMRQMPQMPQNMQRRLREMQLPPMLAKYRFGVYLEYSNSSYITERRLIVLIIILFIIVFGTAAALVYRLYQSNRRLLVKTEQDKQLIQLGEAARTLAHEIRNPLGALKIQRDLLGRKLPPEYSGNLEVMDRELKRLNTLVERVGEFLRNPVGNPERINPVDFASELYGGRADISIAGDHDTEIIFDRERLRTIFDNLVNNALDSGRPVEIILEHGRHTVLEVRDHGPGFSDEALGRLFDPFFTTKNNGTGLGLSVVKRLVESGGGTIEASNLKGGGASVKVIFGDRNENSDS